LAECVPSESTGNENAGPEQTFCCEWDHGALDKRGGFLRAILSRVSVDNPRFCVRLACWLYLCYTRPCWEGCRAVGRNTRVGAHSYAHDPSSCPALARGSEPL